MHVRLTRGRLFTPFYGCRIRRNPSGVNNRFFLFCGKLHTSTGKPRQAAIVGHLGRLYPILAAFSWLQVIILSLPSRFIHGKGRKLYYLCRTYGVVQPCCYLAVILPLCFRCVPWLIGGNAWDEVPQNIRV